MATPVLRPVSSGRFYVFPSLDTVVVGRDPSCDIPLCGGQVAGYISRTHAIFRRTQIDGKTWTLSDNGSVNGVFLNGLKLVPHENVTIGDGDVVVFGDPRQKENNCRYSFENGGGDSHGHPVALVKDMPEPAHRTTSAFDFDLMSMRFDQATAPFETQTLEEQGPVLHDDLDQRENFLAELKHSTSEEYRNEANLKPALADADLVAVTQPKPTPSPTVREAEQAAEADVDATQPVVLDLDAGSSSGVSAPAAPVSTAAPAPAPAPESAPVPLRPTRSSSSSRGRGRGRRDSQATTHTSLSAAVDIDAGLRAEQEACPFCGKAFPIVELIEHSTTCSDAALAQAVELEHSDAAAAVTASTTSAGAPHPSAEATPGLHRTGTLTEMATCSHCGHQIPIVVLHEHVRECEQINADAAGALSASVSASATVAAKGKGKGKRRRVLGGAGMGVAMGLGGGFVFGTGGYGYSDDEDNGEDLGSEDSMEEAEEEYEEEEWATEFGYPAKRRRSWMPMGHPPHARKSGSLKYSGVMLPCPICSIELPKESLEEHAAFCVVAPAGTGGGGSGSAILPSLDHVDPELGAGTSASHDEPLERCPLCFQDFPLSLLYKHARTCEADPTARDRFSRFLPPVSELSAVKILTPRQHQAMQHVIRSSKLKSARAHDKLLKRVKRLGYSEDQLDRTLRYIRDEAPIIIHLNLDRALKYFENDTHYRSQFETRASGGSTDLSARMSWERRMFNGIYEQEGVVPFERVKYGVLNMLGDIKGVRACYSYGDSFLQLKRVRLRTSFASMDSSSPSVKLATCEHYEHVLNEYQDRELAAVVEVAIGRVPYHESTIISTYKEIQVHGAVAFSDHIECIVVNERHRALKAKIERLSRERMGNCNIVWMNDAE